MSGAPRGRPRPGPGAAGTLWAVNRELLILPGAPLLAPELAGADPAAARVRGAVRAGIADLLAADPRRPVILRLAEEHQATGRIGSLAAWGAEVDLGAGRHLPELIARRMLALAGADPAAAAATDRPAAAWAHPGPALVVAEGPAALTPRAPLTELPGAARLDAACAGVAAGAPGAAAELAALDPAEARRVGLHTAPVWSALAVLAAGPAAGATRRVLLAEACLGVGYHVARWSW